MSSPPDTDTAALSTAQTQALLVNLTAAITALVSSRTPAIPVTDHYASNDPFDLTTRAGDHAFEDISELLDTIWDGTAQAFLSFSSVNGKDVLEDSKSITKSEIFAARIARLSLRHKPKHFLSIQ